MNKLSLRTFLLEFGRYFEPAELFYHIRIAEALSRVGFRVLLIERLSNASRWEVRLRATLQAQAQLVGRTFRARSLSYRKAAQLLEHCLKTELRSILGQLGSGIKFGSIVVVRHGTSFRIGFVWPLGTPGKWRPQTGDHPFRVSGMIQNWLKEQRN